MSSISQCNQQQHLYPTVNHNGSLVIARDQSFGIKIMERMHSPSPDDSRARMFQTHTFLYLITPDCLQSLPVQKLMYLFQTAFSKLPLHNDVFTPGFGNIKADLLFEIAKFYADKKDMKKTFEFFWRIKVPLHRSSILSYMSKWQLEAKNPKEAFKIAKTIPDFNIRDKAYLAIINYYFPQNQFEEALEVASFIINELVKYKIYKQIANTYLSNNDIANAYKMTRLIPFDDFKADIIMGIAYFYFVRSDLQNCQKTLLERPQIYVKTMNKYPLFLELGLSNYKLVAQATFQMMESLGTPKNDQQSLKHFYYKILGSNPLRLDLQGGMVLCTHQSCINHLKLFIEATENPVWKNTLNQIVEELVFCQQVTHASFGTFEQPNIIAYYILKRLYQLPIPQDYVKAPFTCLVLDGGVRRHAAKYLIKRTGINAFTFSIINSGLESPLSDEFYKWNELWNLGNSTQMTLEAQLAVEQNPATKTRLQKKIESFQKALKAINDKIANTKTQPITYSHLTFKELSPTFFKILLFLKLNCSDMKEVMDSIQICLGKLDRSNIGFSGRMHKLQRYDNCVEKVRSLFIHERAGTELHRRFKAFMTSYEINELENKIAFWKANPGTTTNETLETAAKYLQAAKEKLAKRRAKISH